MALKKNTQKILLMLFTTSAEQDQTYLQEEVQLAVSDLSPSGFRSLLLLLEKKKLLFREKVAGNTSLGLTEIGKKALVASFPALNEEWCHWDGRWSILVFLEAPHSDPHFRYLRSLLLSERALTLSRGVYAVAGEFSSRVVTECEALYPGNIAIFSVNKPVLGFDRPLIINYYDLATTADLYSGIGKETSLLLEKIKIKKGSIDQYKLDLSSILDRLIDCLRHDPGFLHFYYPGLPGVREVLSQLQRVFNL